jgi:hypothetical protein
LRFREDDLKTCLTPLLLAACLGSAAPAHAAYGDADPDYAPFEGGCSAILPREDGSAYVDAVNASGIAVARLTASGEPDRTWGANGQQAYSTPQSSNVIQLLSGKDGDLFAFDLGYTLSLDATFSVAHVGIEHITAEGQVDTSFGNQGRVELPGSANLSMVSSFLGAALQPDGKIVASIPEGDGTSITFFRLTARGDPDETFGHGGALSVAGADPLDSAAAFGDAAFGWAVRSDGGVELGVYRYEFAPGHVVARLIVVAGDLTAIDAGGRLVPQGVATWMSPRAKVEPTGALVVEWGNRLNRFYADGSFDPFFTRNSDDAISQADPAGLPLGGIGGIATIYAIWREPDGAWTVAGVGQELIGQDYLRALRLDADGHFDRDFGVKQFAAPRGIYRGTDVRPVLRAADGKVLYGGEACRLGRYFTDTPRVESTVVEYYHAGLGHYFLTSSPNEIAGLDGNPFGWFRTGQSFGGWAPSDLPGSVRVCRFYGDPIIGPNSHFYTGQDFECEGLLRLEAAAPPGVPAWHLEGRPFSMAIPAGVTCPPNLAPVYRAFNGPAAGAFGPNHRYTTDPAVYAGMLREGWLAEGVHFCAPPRLN